jgi:hypothetical protein
MRSPQDIAKDLQLGLSKSKADVTANQLSCLLAINGNCQTADQKAALRSILADEYPDDYLFNYAGDVRGSSPHPYHNVRLVNVNRVKALAMVTAFLAAPAAAAPAAPPAATGAPLAPASGGTSDPPAASGAVASQPKTPAPNSGTAAAPTDIAVKVVATKPAPSSGVATPASGTAAPADATAAAKAAGAKP